MAEVDIGGAREKLWGRYDQNTMKFSMKKNAYYKEYYLLNIILERLQQQKQHNQKKEILHNN